MSFISYVMQAVMKKALELAPDSWLPGGKPAALIDQKQGLFGSSVARAPPPFEVQHWSMHSHGAMFCEVRVNAITGEPRVSRFLGSFDCGRIINAKTAASQFRGGIVMGLGLALMEEPKWTSAKVG